MATRKPAYKQKSFSSHLGSSIGYCLVRAAKTAREKLDKALEPLDLVAPQLGIMYMLADLGPLSQIEIGGRIAVDRATMVKLIDGLEARGLVVRRADPADRRANRIELTKSGKTILSKATSCERAMEKDLLAGLTRSEAKHLRELLPLLVGTL